jgi:hypothetical protein
MYAADFPYFTGTRVSVSEKLPIAFGLHLFSHYNIFSSDLAVSLHQLKHIIS